MSRSHFKGSRVLVTGASGGIGRATALAFSNYGARVAVHYNKGEEEAKATLNLLEGKGHACYAADLENPEAIKDMVDGVASHFGGIDILVNNAGVYLPHPIAEVTYESWQHSWQSTLAINLTGAAHVCYCVAQYMIRQGGGRIVNVSSRGAFRGEPDHPAYGASKAGLNAMSQSLAIALARHGVFVGVVAPGFVQTPMASEVLNGPKGDQIRNQSPLRRVARPEEVSKAILFLAAEGTEFTTGCILDINGASYLRS